jgi:hypothetical protein
VDSVLVVFARRRSQARKIADHLGIVRPVQLIETVSYSCDFPLRKNDVGILLVVDLDHLIVELIADQRVDPAVTASQLRAKYRPPFKYR